MTTPRLIIAKARGLYNDADSVLYRIEDDELLGYVNDGILEFSTRKPMIFSTIGDMPCTQGEVEHAVTFSDAQALIEVICIHGGKALTVFDMATLDAFNPNWRQDAEGEAEQWSKKDGDPLRFFITPPAPSGQVVDIRYVKTPTVLQLDDPITEMPEGYTPALIDYVIHRAESRDDEHAVSGRAALHLQAFNEKIGV